MEPILPADVLTQIGATDPLIVDEIVQTRASLREWKQALSLVEGADAQDLMHYDQLNDRLRRLIDLLSVANGPFGSPRGSDR